MSYAEILVWCLDSGTCIGPENLMKSLTRPYNEVHQCYTTFISLLSKIFLNFRVMLQGSGVVKHYVSF